jgi:hypothetical protein
MIDVYFSPSGMSSRDTLQYTTPNVYTVPQRPLPTTRGTTRVYSMPPWNDHRANWSQISRGMSRYRKPLYISFRNRQPIPLSRICTICCPFRVVSSRLLVGYWRHPLLPVFPGFLCGRLRQIRVCVMSFIADDINAGQQYSKRLCT